MQRIPRSDLINFCYVQFMGRGDFDFCKMTTNFGSTLISSHPFGYCLHKFTYAQFWLYLEYRLYIYDFYFSLPLVFNTLFLSKQCKGLHTLLGEANLAFNLPS